jgi:hypothetical protein
MNPTVWLYLIYLAISILLTVWVAQTLHKNGRIFLVDCFGGNEPIADSVNHLLVVGFYLIDLGFITANLRDYEQLDTTQTFLLSLSGKVGGLALMLGAILLLSLFILSKISKQTSRK